MVRLFVRHTIEDFNAWKAVYDEFEHARLDAGISNSAVYQDVDDAKVLTTADDFATIEDAEAFVLSESLKSGTRRAGVVGEPQIWFATRVA